MVELSVFVNLCCWLVSMSVRRLVVISDLMMVIVVRWRCLKLRRWVVVDVICFLGLFMGGC